MSAAVWALIALLSTILLSVTTRLNVGILAVAMAWLVGVYSAHLKPDVIAEGFPSTLFMTLLGVALLFGLASVNGTLDALTHRAVALARGEARWLPLFFFLLAGLLSSAGPGAVSSVALLAPIAMAVAIKAEVPVFLMALMVANGANAGNLSPISSVGIIANTKMAEAGLGGHEFKVWLANFVAHLVVAMAAYFGLRGHRLARTPTTLEAPPTLSRSQQLTLVVIVVWIVGVVALKVPVGLSAFLAATLVIAGRLGDETAAIKAVPWAVIVMVCGVSVLIGILEHTGGMELFTGLLARLASPKTLDGVIALVTGAISTYSSTSGVVLPAFLPTSAGLVAKVGGGDPLAVALSINVGSSIVDVSPLSTLGALCVAAIANPADARRLFRQLLVWGLSMTVVGALLCQFLAPALARW